MNLNLLCHWLNLILSYAVSGYVLMQFFLALFKPRFPRWTRIAAWGGFVAGAILLNLTQLPLVKSGFGLFSSCLIAQLLFDCPNPRKKIAAAIFFFLYLLILDALSVQLLSLCTAQAIAEIQDNALLLFVSGVGNQIALLCSYRGVILLIKRRPCDGIARHQSLFLLFLADFEILELHFSIHIVEGTLNRVILALLSLGFLVLDLCLIRVFDAISLKYQLETAIALKDQQLHMQDSYYRSLELQHEKSQRLLHDTKNHLLTLEALYNTGAADEAQAYTEALLKRLAEADFKYHCANKIFSMIINDKILKCEKRGIRFEISLDGGLLDFLSPFDMTTIFSNLLDNAIEAAAALKDRGLIEITGHRRRGMLFIDISNTCDPSKINWSPDGRLQSTKSAAPSGLGLKNVAEAVGKYGGALHITVDTTFNVHLYFPLAEES
ncbi:MAG: GHKL domain-containing protein [Eubacterium sp.]|nr:GHKL domain-containing protein [Eubacterium sp.]